MRRLSKSERRLRLNKETLRSLSADELELAGGGGLALAASLSGSRKCVTSTACIEG